MAQENSLAGAIVGTATAALEAGTLNGAAAIVLRSGFDHRMAALKAVTVTDAAFVDSAGMRAWLEDLDPELADDPMWPTDASRDAWVRFAGRVGQQIGGRWSRRIKVVDHVTWDEVVPEQGQWLRVTREDSDHVGLWSPGFDRVGTGRASLAESRAGLLHALVGADGLVTLRYRGPNDWLVREPEGE